MRRHKSQREDGVPCGQQHQGVAQGDVQQEPAVEDVVHVPLGGQFAALLDDGGPIVHFGQGRDHRNEATSIIHPLLSEPILLIGRSLMKVAAPREFQQPVPLPAHQIGNPLNRFKPGT